MSERTSNPSPSPLTTRDTPEARAFRQALDVISEVEPRVSELIRAELADQRRFLKLIASENYASPAVLLAMGNWFSDKYAEGSIGHRFYAGCDNVDQLEALASQLACEVFGAEHAYVQPHSGIDANLVAYWAILAARVEAPALEAAEVKHVNDLTDDDWAALRRDLGNQRLVGMSLDAGGHLTHGFRPNISGKMFDQRSYGVDENGIVDYDEVRRLAHEFEPLILVAGYSAYPRKVNFRVMREIADEVGAVLMVDMAHFAGLVAGGVFTGDFDPVRHGHVVTTTTHKSLRGPRGGIVMCTSEFAPFVDKGCPMVLGGPLVHVIAAKAVALAEARSDGFRTYARAIVDNATALAEGLQARGGTLVSGGTENHLMLLDVTSFGLTGRQAESALREGGLTVNRNSIPHDPNGAWYTSGVRLGTPALTTLGMGPTEMDEVAAIIVDVLDAAEPTTTSSGSASKARYSLDPQVAAECRNRAGALLDAFPLYPTVGVV